MPETENQDRSPFKDTSEPSTFPSRSTLETLQNNPEIVLRKVDWLEGDINQQVEKVANYRNLVSDLEVLGIRSPLLGTIISESGEGEPVVWLVTKKVSGQNILNEGLANRDASEGLVRTLVHYYRGFIARGGEYVDELRLEQFVNGHTYGEVQDGVYLVDLDPSVGYYDATSPTSEERENMLANLELLELDAKHLDANADVMKMLDDAKASVTSS